MPDTVLFPQFVLYLLAFVMMTTKFFVLDALATETKQGEIRQRETGDVGISTLLKQYGGVLQQILRTPKTVLALGVMLVMNICLMINGTFWGILVTGRLEIPEQYIAIFPFAKSMIMLLFYFFIMPKIAQVHFKKPMLTGFALIM